MRFASALEFWEFLSYLVTVLGLPVAVWALWREARAERENERKEIEQREDELYVSLSEQYSGFLEAVLANPDLDLLSETPSLKALSDEQKQKKIVYYEMLLALFERAYILLYEPNLSGDALRRWRSWADYIEWWIARPDFCEYAQSALQGEDPDFAQYVRTLMAEREGQG